MTHEELTGLDAARQNLFCCAHVYVQRTILAQHVEDAEHQLQVAAKRFAATVNQINKGLWNPTVIEPQEYKANDHP